MPEQITQQPQAADVQDNRQPAAASQGDSDLDLSKSIPIASAQQDSDLDLSKSIPVAKPRQLQTGGMADIVPAGTQATSIGARPTGTRSAIDQKLGLWGPTEVGNWIKDVEADYRQGSATTWVGSLLKRLGARGVEYGVAPGIATPLGGVIKLAHGGTQVGEHPIRAANEMVSGVGEMLGPAAVTQPEALPFIATAEIGGKLGYHTAKYFGADDDIAEMVGGRAVVVSMRPAKPTFLQKVWRRIVGLLN